MSAIHGILIMPLTPSHLNSAIPILAQSFHDGEPTTSASCVTLEGHLGFFKLLCPRMCDNNLSMVAIDDESGALAGVFLAEDFSNAPPNLDDLIVAHPGFAPVFELLDRAEDIFRMKRNIDPGSIQEQGRFNHLYCVAISPNYGRRGIATALTNKVLQAAKELGYEESFAEATGKYSATVLGKSGMEIEATIEYANENSALKNIPLPHEGLSLVTIKHR